MNRSHVNFIRTKVKKKKSTVGTKKKTESRYIPVTVTSKSGVSFPRIALMVGMGVMVGAAGYLGATSYVARQTAILSQTTPVVQPANPPSIPNSMKQASVDVEVVQNAPVVEAIQEKNDIMTWEEATMLNDLQAKNIQGVQSVKKGVKGDVSVVLNTDQFFMIGTAKISNEKVPQLSEIAGALKATAKDLGSQVSLEIEAHTDDSPIVKQKHLYQSNWELSAARAASLVHLFEEAGFEKDQMKLVGYGDSRPVVPNRDPSGELIVGNAVKNRRIVLRVYPADSQKGSM
jgi:flagellar motor protein MotB